jgi:hypothetical protein
VRIRNFTKTDKIFLALTTGFAISILFFGLSGTATTKSESKILLIGLNTVNDNVPGGIPVSLYQKNLSEAMDSVHESLMTALQKKNKNAKAAPGWHLNSVGVGLGFAGNFGLGPLVNVTVSPQIRLVFSNSATPIYPN